jgi:hypothetical protein
LTKKASAGVFFQKLDLEVELQEVGKGRQPGNDIGNFASDFIKFSPAVGSGEFPNLLQKPEEGFVRSPGCIPVTVNIADELLKFLDFQGEFSPCGVPRSNDFYFITMVLGIIQALF